MTLPSFEKHYGDERPSRIYFLEVCDSNDRSKKPIAWLLVERQEKSLRNDRDGSIIEAKINLHYWRIVPKHSHLSKNETGQFSGRYSYGFNNEALVSLTSSSACSGFVNLNLQELEGQRIGTYLMNQIVIWAKKWPDAAVRPIELLSGQSYSENKERRNRFYEQFGLEFDYKDSSHEAGLSRSIAVRSLNTVET